MDKELKTSFRLDDEVKLRTFIEADAEQIFDVVDRNREHLQTFMRWMTPDYSLSSARDFVKRAAESFAGKRNTSYGIFRNERLIGSIGFVYFDWEARKTEIGYWIARDEQGKGLISAAVRCLIDYAFDDLGMNRIEIHCSTENSRSAAVASRLGFRKEGEFRQAELIHGRLHDFEVYALLADDARLW